MAMAQSPRSAASLSPSGTGSDIRYVSNRGLGLGLVGPRVQGPGSRVSGQKSGVWGLGSRFWGLGGLRSRV
eukprot:1872764-Rhodomonas_salina.1